MTTAIIRHLRPLDGRQMRMDTTCGHLRSLAATCGHLLSAVTCGLSAVTCGHLRALAVTCGHLLSAVTCCHLRSLEWLQVTASGWFSENQIPRSPRAQWELAWINERTKKPTRDVRNDVQIGHMASCQYVAWAQALITWVRCALKSTALPTLQLWILEHPNSAVAKNIAVHILRTWLKIPSHLESLVLQNLYVYIYMFPKTKEYNSHFEL